MDWKLQFISEEDFIYALVTGQEDALYQIHMMLPEMVRKNMQIFL